MPPPTISLPQIPNGMFPASAHLRVSPCHRSDVFDVCCSSVPILQPSHVQCFPCPCRRTLTASESVHMEIIGQLINFGRHLIWKVPVHCRCAFLLHVLRSQILKFFSTATVQAPLASCSRSTVMSALRPAFIIFGRTASAPVEPLVWPW